MRGSLTVPAHFLCVLSDRTQAAGDFGQLLGAGAPAVLEAHRVVCLGVLGVLVKNGRGVASLAVAGVLKRVDGGEREAVAAIIRENVGAVTWEQGARPYDPCPVDHLEDTGVAFIVEA